MTTILIVEDNEQNLGLMRYLVRNAGLETLEARDGEEGVRVALSERPDLIIMDLQMPKLDGYGAIAAIRSDPALADVTVVAVTAYSMTGDRERAIAAGFDHYLSKPIDPWSFSATIRNFLDAAAPTAD